MDSGSVIIRAQQRNGCIGMGLVFQIVSVRFFRKLKEALPEDFVIILVQLTNSLFGTILVSHLAIFPLFQTQKVTLSANSVGIYALQPSTSIGTVLVTPNVISHFLLQESPMTEISVTILAK